MDRKQGLVKNTFIIGIGTSLSKLLSVLLVGMYTVYISPADFGYYELLLTIMTMLTPLVSLQIIEAMYRHLLDTRDDTEVSRVMTSALTVVCGGLLLSSLVLAVVNLSADIRLGWILPGYLITTILFGFGQTSARGLKRNSVFALSGVVYTCVMLLSNIILIIGFKMGVEALFLSTMIADIVGIVILEISIRVFRRIRPSMLSGNILKAMCRYSIPLLPNAITWWTLMLISRYAIIHFVGMDASGIFAVATKFPALLITVFNIFGLAWQESAITEYGAQDRNAYFSRTFNHYMRVLLSAMLVLLPATRYLIGYVIDAGYYEAWKYIPFLYMSSIFQAFAQFFATGYYGAKKTAGAFVTTLIGVVFGFLCLALMPVIGLQAASLAQMTAYLVILASRMIHIRKYVHVSVQWRDFCALVALTAVYICLYYCVDTAAAGIAQFAFASAMFLVFNRKLIQTLLAFAHSGLKKGENA